MTKESEFYRKLLTDEEKAICKEIFKSLPGWMRLEIKMYLHEDFPDDFINGAPYDDDSLQQLILWCEKYNFSEDEIKLLPYILKKQNEEWEEWRNNSKNHITRNRL